MRHSFRQMKGLPVAERRKRRQRMILCCVLSFTALLMSLYVASFFWLRHHRVEFSLAAPGSPQRYPVFFSHRAESQEVLRDLYSPLIRLFPGGCYYPNGEETELFFRCEKVEEDQGGKNR